MIRDVMGLLEIFSFLYAFAATYGKKMKCNIYAVIFVIAELVILSGMNNHGMATYLLGLSYLLMFLYCLLNYRRNVKETIIRCILGFVEVSIVQMVCYFLLSFTFDFFRLETMAKEMLVTLVYSAIVILASQHMHLDKISEFFLQKSRLLKAAGVVILILLGSQIWNIKKVHVLDGKLIFSIVLFALILILLIVEWEKSRTDAEKKKMQLEMNQLYYGAYESLIQSIRDKQHDFKNHLNAIEGMAYSINDYTELVKEQRHYIQDITGDLELTKLLTMVENPLIAGFLNYKVAKAKDLGIEVRYDCALGKYEGKTPEFQIIEMMGIIIDNAFEETVKCNNKIVILKLSSDKGIMLFFVENPYLEDGNVSEAVMFERGYSSKGTGRGIGLSKLKRMINMNGGEIIISKEKELDMNMLKVEIKVNL